MIPTAMLVTALAAAGVSFNFQRLRREGGGFYAGGLVISLITSIWAWFGLWPDTPSDDLFERLTVLTSDVTQLLLVWGGLFVGWKVGD